MAEVLGIWTQYGYSASPYSTTALKPTNADARLLVGRDHELEIILSDLASGVQLVALEGGYGVGKSSLAAVATAQATSWTQIRGEKVRFLATSKPLELTDSDSAAALEKRAYYQIAAALLLAEAELRAAGFGLQQMAEFRAWLSSPQASSWSAGIGASVPLVAGVNASMGRGKTMNTSQGFTDEGAINLVDAWLREVFPTPQSGGVILLLDNLESLGKHSGLIDVFESLRDRLFKRDGLRWIISGAEGMVGAGLRTQKMSGVFAEPIEVEPLDHTYAQLVIERRAEVVEQRDDAHLPVSPAAFEAAYLATGQNLRFTLGLAERYSLRSSPKKVMWMSPQERATAFRSYQINEGKKVVAQLTQKLKGAALKVLRVVVIDKNGLAYPSEYGDFGYTTMPPLLTQLKTLSSLGLITYTPDKDDARRRLIAATDNGRLVIASELAQ